MKQSTPPSPFGSSRSLSSSSSSNIESSQDSKYEQDGFFDAESTTGKARSDSELFQDKNKQATAATGLNSIQSELASFLSMDPTVFGTGVAAAATTDSSDPSARRESPTTSRRRSDKASTSKKELKSTQRKQRSSTRSFSPRSRSESAGQRSRTHQLAMHGREKTRRPDSAKQSTYEKSSSRKEETVPSSSRRKSQTKANQQIALSEDHHQKKNLKQSQSRKKGRIKSSGKGTGPPRRNSRNVQYHTSNPESKAEKVSLSLSRLGPLVNSTSLLVLGDMALSISETQETVHTSVKNDGFVAAADMAYKILLEIRPRLKYLLSLAEWRHVHVLMLYTRVLECELAAANKVAPYEYQIALPSKVQILEPMAAVLASIGIVDDLELGVTYIPVAKPIVDDNYMAPNPEDVTEFLEWKQYDWNLSWANVLAGRKRRRKEAEENDVKLPQGNFQPNYDKLLEWEQLAVEKWLGWDDDLWFSYSIAVDALSRVAAFVDFPRQAVGGTYAWLIPREEFDGTNVWSSQGLCLFTDAFENCGAFCRIPKTSLAPEEWMVALLFNLSDLGACRTRTWYHKTKPTADVSAILEKFLRAALK